MSAQSGSNTQLRGRRLVLARAAWISLVALSLALFAAAVPARYDQLSSLSGAALFPGWTSDALRTTLAQLGFSVGLYTAYRLTLEIALVLIYCAVALVIFWRKPDDWMAMLVALGLVTFAIGFLAVSTLSALVAIQPVWELLLAFVNVLGSGAILLAWYLFPDGRFVPRWTRGLSIAWAVWVIGTVFFPPDTWHFLFYLLTTVGWYGSGALAQTYRYVRVSGPVQRQQTKWVLFGSIVAFLGFAAQSLPLAIFPSLREPGPAYVLYTLITRPLVNFCCFLPVPLSIAFSILRYRLWDIDIIIRRTLIYSTLTGCLALVYFGSIVLLQTLFRALTGQQQPEIVTVISTLTIAALFAPLRRRVQDGIDHRFYRRKYDAAQILAAFSATARDEVDLNKLTARLVQVVEDTLQPESVSLWLNPSLPSPSLRGRGGRAGNGGEG